jgi:hypothetical protein
VPIRDSKVLIWKSYFKHPGRRRLASEIFADG